jgi:hypothetical protein
MARSLKINNDYRQLPYVPVITHYPWFIPHSAYLCVPRGRKFLNDLTTEDAARQCRNQKAQCRRRVGVAKVTETARAGTGRAPFRAALRLLVCWFRLRRNGIAIAMLQQNLPKIGRIGRIAMQWDAEVGGDNQRLSRGY